MLNLGEHRLESTSDTLVSFKIYVSFTLALGMLWVGWVVDNRARDPIRKLRDASSDEVIDVERHSSNRGCFVAGRKASIEASPGRVATHVLVSGLKNLNPRSESRPLSWPDSHGLEANPPTRKACCA